MKTSKIITSDKWIMQVLEKMDIDYTKARRVVIDAMAGQPLVIYIERYGDERLLEVEPPEASGVVIKCAS